jgi:type II secretory pathway pseudopilin PulG
MTACTQCGEFVAATVDACPHCGTKVEGFAQLARTADKPKRWNRTTLIVPVVMGCLLAACSGLLLFAFVPAIQSARDAARRTQCLSNLRAIGTALLSYSTEYGSLPPAYIADETGRPMHSWRVLILPHLGEQTLYNAYNFSEPWDGPNNSRLHDQIPDVYVCSSRGNKSTNTRYAGVFGEHCMFRGAEPVRYDDVLDGLGATLLVGETAGAKIHWMQPVDIDITIHPLLGDREGFSSDHVQGVNFVWCDGTVRPIPTSMDQETLKALFSRDGGEQIGANY